MRSIPKGRTPDSHKTAGHFARNHFAWSKRAHLLFVDQPRHPGTWSLGPFFSVGGGLPKMLLVVWAGFFLGFLLGSFFVFLLASCLGLFFSFCAGAPQNGGCPFWFPLQSHNKGAPFKMTDPDVFASSFFCCSCWVHISRGGCKKRFVFAPIPRLGLGWKFRGSFPIVVPSMLHSTGSDIHIPGTHSRLAGRVLDLELELGS